jgi:hypothetical protein
MDEVKKTQWIVLAQERNHRRALVNMIIDLRVLQKVTVRSAYSFGTQCIDPTFILFFCLSLY